MDISKLLSDRTQAINGSGIRRVFELKSKLIAEGRRPIDLSIGQPHFPVPEAVKQAAIDAIRQDRNAYTVNQGIAELRARLGQELAYDLGWRTDAVAGAEADCEVMVTSGTSGAITLACLALLGPGDEAIIPDPYFVAYPHLATLSGARAVRCDTYPDFRMTASRVEPLITERTKLVMFNSPSNPAGVVTGRRDCEELLDLCRRRNVLLISDEIYDLFTYSDSRTDRQVGGRGLPACPSPARAPGAAADMLVVRGFGKTYACTGWRLGYAAGPRALMEELKKLQQYTYVCAPTPLQWGVLAAMDVDMTAHVQAYQRRRDRVVERLSELTEVATPGGAFYAFPKVPARLGITGAQFMERCLEKSLMIVPGKAFSSRDTHFRLSYATDEATLERGLDVLIEVMKS
jgi:aminotransferase